MPDARLIIAGDGDHRNACEKIAQAEDIKDCVRFTGFVNEIEKQRLLAGAWVFAQPSRLEGWGISVIEAAACGTPAVAMRVPGLSDAIVDGETGILADDWAGFQRAIVMLLTNASLRERLATEALRRSKQFTWERTAAGLLQILQRVSLRERSTQST